MCVNVCACRTCKEKRTREKKKNERKWKNVCEYSILVIKHIKIDLSEII